MDLQQLESFVRVAELGSLTRAALVAGVSQPTLSRHIRLLELELKSHLLVRTGRGVELTESGKCLLSYGNAILKLTRQARADIQALREQPTGRLTVGLPPRIAHVLTPELVKQFRRLYPEASISVSEGLSVALREDLILGKIEIALLFDPPPSPGSNTSACTARTWCCAGVPSKRSRCPPGWRPGNWSGIRSSCPAFRTPCAT